MITKSTHPDDQYLNLASHILYNGTRKDDRTGTGTISYFGAQMRFDLEQGFPLLTTKRVPFRLIVAELMWFLRGDTNIKYLLDRDVHIWDGDALRGYKELCSKYGLKPVGDDDFLDHAKREGYDLGPIYGAQWRSWPTYRDDKLQIGQREKVAIDQIKDVIKQIKHNPDSRRHVVSAWNPADLDKMVLPPCHILFQFYVANGKLSCQLYQRSGDFFLGVPFNIASYALLTHMVAQVTGLGVGEFVHTIGDAHIYTNHVDQIREQRSRKPMDLPRLQLNRNITDIDGFSEEDIALIGYNSHPAIKGEVSNG